ncbi:hypothetical protein EsH8_III_000320 [Colletotrichum jinshuiense]
MSSESLDQTRLRELLQRHGIGAWRATRASGIELRAWAPADVEAVLRQLTPGKPNHNPCGREFNRYTGLSFGQRALIYSCVGIGLGLGIPILVVHSAVRLVKQRTFSVFRQTWDEYALGKLLSLASEFDQYVMAPVGLVRQSVDRRAALCVNRDGVFQVMTSGYSVMSHVWEETMGWNSPEGFGKVDLALRKKGIHKTHFLKFFERCGATWLWVDVLAMPEILEDMTPPQQADTESLRVGVINNLSTIYRNADKVFVFDSLALQLKTGSLIDVAVVLSLGRWITRMWTLAEARLGRRVLIKTADGEADLDEIVALLEDEVAERYVGLGQTLAKKRGDAPPKPKYELSDLVDAYRYAHTGESIDSVRAAYPLLGLEWEAGWDQKDGMLHLIKELPTESASLASLSGEQGLPEPYHEIPLGLNMLRGDMSPSPPITAENVTEDLVNIT